MIVEKYVGEPSIDNINELDDELLSQANLKSNPIFWLVDITETLLPSIEPEDIHEMFKSIDRYRDEIHEMKVALFHGTTYKVEVGITYKYAQEGIQRDIPMMPFSDLDGAFRWLELTMEEKKTIRDFLDNPVKNLLNVQ